MAKLFTSIDYATGYNQLVSKLLVLVHQLSIPGPHLKSHTSNLTTYVSLDDTLFAYGNNLIDFTFKTRDEFFRGTGKCSNNYNTLANRLIN